MSLLGRSFPLQQVNPIPFSSMGYHLPRGYPPYPYHPLQGFAAGIDPACISKYEPAWGADYDRFSKANPIYKSGELPPATPNPDQLIKEGYQGRPIRHPLMPFNEKMFNLSMNSPMYINMINETSPRPPTTRQPYPGAGQPSALNVTVNFNVNGGEFRPSSTLPTPQ